MIGGESREIRGKEIGGTEERKSAYLCLEAENHRLEIMLGESPEVGFLLLLSIGEVRLLLVTDEEMTRRLQRG